MANYIKKLQVMEVAIVDRPAVPKAKFLLFKRAVPKAGVIPFEAAPAAPEEAPWDLTDDKRAALPDSAFLWVGPKQASEGAGKLSRKGAHHDHDGRVVWKAIATLGALLDRAWSRANMPEESLAEARKHIEGHYHQFGRLAPWEREKEDQSDRRGEAPRAEMLQVASLIAGAVAEAVKSISPVAAGTGVAKSDGAAFAEKVLDLGERVGKLEAAFGRASIPGQDTKQARESIWKGVF